MIIIKRSDVQEVNNHILSKEAKEFKETLDRMAKFAPEGIKVTVNIDAVQDNDDPSIIYPIQHETIIPAKYHMQFNSTRKVLFFKENDLTMLDHYLFHYLCEEFAEHHKFYINSDFWELLLKDIEEMNLSYSQNSFRNSLARLVKSKLIFKVKKGIYVLNKAYIFAGPLINRLPSIEEQFNSQTPLLLKNKKK